MDGCGDETSVLALGNRMDKKYEVDDVPHIENGDAVMTVIDSTHIWMIWVE